MKISPSLKKNMPQVSCYNTFYFLRYASRVMWNVYKHTETIEMLKVAYF